jgi:hypothetical protein
MTPSQAIVFSRMRFGLGPVTRMPPIFSDCAMVNDGLKACTVTAWGSLVGLVWSSHRRLVCHNEETCPLAGLVKVVAMAIGSALLGDGDGSDKLSKYGHTAREPMSMRGDYWPWPGGPSWPTPYLV